MLVFKLFSRLNGPWKVALPLFEALTALPASVSCSVMAKMDPGTLKPAGLTLQPAVTPSPPAHTILSVARTLHQSCWLHRAWPTTGSSACCRTSASTPSAGGQTVTQVSPEHQMLLETQGDPPVSYTGLHHQPDCRMTGSALSQSERL